MVAHKRKFTSEIGSWNWTEKQAMCIIFLVTTFQHPKLYILPDSTTIILQYGVHNACYAGIV